MNKILAKKSTPPPSPPCPVFQSFHRVGDVPQLDSPFNLFTRLASLTGKKTNPVLHVVFMKTSSLQPDPEPTWRTWTSSPPPLQSPPSLPKNFFFIGKDRHFIGFNGSTSIVRFACPLPSLSSFVSSSQLGSPHCSFSTPPLDIRINAIDNMEPPPVSALFLEFSFLFRLI